ncbi:MAG: hypothetical protein AAB638_01140 [Patescibacteria group bacterium]
MRKYISKLRPFVPAVLFGLPILAYANLPAGNAITLTDIDNMAHLIARFLIVTSMILAVIFIVLSGIMVMAAQADPARYKNGLVRLKHAAIGIGVVLATGVIINTIAGFVDRSFFCQISIIGICIY